MCLSLWEWLMLLEIRRMMSSFVESVRMVCKKVLNFTHDKMHAKYLRLEISIMANATSEVRNENDQEETLRK